MASNPQKVHIIKKIFYKNKKNHLPATKHCQTGVGQEWDQVRGESMGEEEEGAGDEESGNTRDPVCCCCPPLLLAIRLGMGP